MTTEERLRERCIALENLINSIREYYSEESTSKNQRAFIETIIGAAIWYLPHGKDYWNNKVSKAAISSLRDSAEVRLTRDHIYPRKDSAKKLLTDAEISLNGDGTNLKELYQKELGKYILVTPDENRRLVAIQKNHNYGKWEDAYEEAGIELFDYEQILESEEEEFLQMFRKKR
ncbi:hypothetical protein ACFQO1_05190 [Jejudonia soesokkakensis]|uniref:Uncharacterized protein n=1 Tax=Jejudonia soesokkakensis TaxID=1323432 RepID=A0ABW2MTS2_9FLAO